MALLALVFLFAPQRSAAALESTEQVSKRSAVALVSETDSYVPGETLRLGLRFRLRPGWHIYWTNPGEAGAAPDLAWTLPDGAHVASPVFPAPERLGEGTATSFGYTGEVLLPVTMTPPPGDAPFTAELAASWLICEKLCVPEEGRFTLTLPAGPGTKGAQAAAFAAADARTPRPSPFAARIAPDGTLSIEGTAVSPATVAGAAFFPAEQGIADPNAPQRSRVEQGRVTLALVPAKPGGVFSAPLDGVLTLRDPAGGVSAYAVSASAGAVAATGETMPLLRILLLAFAGGLLLNLMPCVFPVLAMKALAIARLGGRDRHEVQAQAASYAAGVVLSFIALGLMLVGMRGAGSAFGWGFQFQSPVFVAAIAFLLFLLGLNLSGVFEITAGRLTGAGQGLAERPGHLGSFFTGVLAVIVATPCTAPFMGAAIAAALAASIPATLAVFATLGLGLAAPSVLLALWPALARTLPKPGGWMTVLRQALAFPLYAACAWLLWVIAQQAGESGVLAVASGFVLLGLAAWAFGRAQMAGGRAGRGTGLVVAALAGMAAIAVLPRLPALAEREARSEVAPMATERFSTARLAALRAEGRPVFVDMTAAWCVTCIINEQVTLTQPAVQDAFAARRVVYMKGDWTRQDPEITAFLRDHGRDGVPLYVFYPPGGPPTILPQVLTQAMILDEFGRLGG